MAELANYSEVKQFKEDHKNCNLKVISNENNAILIHCHTDGAQISTRIPYTMFCIQPLACAGLNSCPRSYACSE